MYIFRFFFFVFFFFFWGNNATMVKVANVLSELLGSFCITFFITLNWKPQPLWPTQLQSLQVPWQTLKKCLLLHSIPYIQSCDTHKQSQSKAPSFYYYLFMVSYFFLGLPTYCADIFTSATTCLHNNNSRWLYASFVFRKVLSAQPSHT